MPKCPNGHEQRLGMRCQTCGANISFREAVSELLTLPKIQPDYGSVSILTLGYPRLSLPADFVGGISAGQADLKTSTTFQVTNIRGGNWLDYQKKYLKDLRRWMTLVGIDESKNLFLVVDTTNPLSILALSALPNLEHTALIAFVADPDSTPIEQNTSYVALSFALKKGIPVIALSETFEREMLYFTEARGFATGADAVTRLLDPLIAAADDVMDLLERDLKLGIKMHCLSAILAGSKGVYGSATNAFTAQSYSLSTTAKPEASQTISSLVFAGKETRGEFEKSFDVFRNRRFKGALSAEFRFHESASPLYDMVTIYGVKSEGPLQNIAEGYQAIVGSVPQLSAEGVY